MTETPVPDTSRPTSAPVEPHDTEPSPNDADTDPTGAGTGAAPGAGLDSIDLDLIARDLQDVQTALERLDAGTYWTDEVTGDPIAEEILVARPTARTATPTPH